MSEGNQKAAVLTLDYEDGRMEFTVLYYSENWKELQDLIADPRGFFRKIRVEYNIWSPGNRVKGWEFGKGPITGIFQHVNSTPEKKQVFENFGMAEDTQDPDEETLTEKGLESDIDFIGGLDVPEGETGSDNRQGGSFLAEFAINTLTLTVTYDPPTGGTPHISDEGLSKIIVAFPDISIRDTNYCNVHLDLPGGGKRRAEIAVAYLEKPQVLADLINRHVHAHDPAVKETIGINSNRLIARPHYRNGRRMDVERPRSVTPQKAKGMNFEIDSEGLGVRMLVLEGLGMPEPFTTCVIGSVVCSHPGHDGDPTLFKIGAVTGKFYLSAAKAFPA